MPDNRQNELARREMLVAYITVMDRLDELLEVCSAVEGDTDELRRAVQERFGLGPIGADAVISLQVRRFTPVERQKIRDALVDLDLSLEGSSGT